MDDQAAPSTAYADLGAAAYFTATPTVVPQNASAPAASSLPGLAPTGHRHAARAAAPGLPWQLLLPIDELRSCATWLRGWVGLFGAAAIAPFVLLRVVSHDTDLHRAAIGFAVYFAVVWGVAIHAVVKPQRVPIGLALRVGVFTVGCGVAIALGLEKHLGAGTGNLLKSIATVGVPEEIAKAAPLVLFMLLGRREYSVRTYIFVGALSGLLFGAAEAVSYSSLYEEVLAFGDAPLAVIAEVWRLLTDGLFHACMAGLSAFFIGLAWHVRTRRVELVVAGVTVAAVMHGAYDALANGWAGTCVAAAIVLMFLGYVRSADRVTAQLAPDSGTAGPAAPASPAGAAALGQKGVAVLVAVIVAGASAAYLDHHHQQSAVQQQAHEEHVAEVQSSLRNAATAEETYLVDYGTYTSNSNALAVEGYLPAGPVDLVVVSAEASIGYCLTASFPGDDDTTSYYDSTAGGLSTTPCF